MTSTAHQSSGTAEIAALLRARWQQIRSPWRRRLLKALVVCLPGSAVGIYLLAVNLPSTEEAALETRVLLPTLLAAFALFSVITPVVAGGGASLFPPDQLVAFPVRLRSFAWMALLLLPINVTWVAQVLMLLGATGFGVAPLPTRWTVLPGLLLWVAACTVVGATIAWAIVGMRQRRDGRIATWIVGGSLVIALVLLVVGDQLLPFLDRLPTRYVAARMIVLPGRDWAELLVALVLVLAVGLVALPRVCAWALRRPSDHGYGSATRIVPRRRALPATAALVRKDCVAVWRTPSLRRGIVTLALLPLVLAGFSDVSWNGLVLVPGLVAAGAVLLYGVNAFCLDATGSVWLCTLPTDPGRLLTAKFLSLALVTGVPALLAVVVGAVAIQEPPSAVQLSAVLAAAVSGVMISVARGLRSSLDRPQKADLLGPRDTPAPHGLMAFYSLDLAGRCTLSAVWLSLSLLGDAWWLPVLMAVPVILLAAMSLAGTERRWADFTVRSRVITSVAYG